MGAPARRKKPLKSALKNASAPSDPHELLKAFQSNFLSLISHELRTPLTGILNSLGLMEDTTIKFTEEHESGFTAKELLKMAHRNAHRLNDTLSALLDIAAIESGTFNPKLHEIDFHRIALNARNQMAERFGERQIRIKIAKKENKTSEQKPSLEFLPVLADPQKMNRALNLCFQLVLSFAQKDSDIFTDIRQREMGLEFDLDPNLFEEWTNALREADEILENENQSQEILTAFRGVMGKEEQFLTRTVEGLGSEIFILREIMKAHEGEFFMKETKGTVKFKLILPQYSAEEGLEAVLSSRVFEASTGLASVALAFLEAPKGMKMEEFYKTVQENLFRSSDAVYAIPKKNKVALVLNDCKREDVPGLLSRFEKYFDQPLSYGAAVCPEEATSPKELIELSESQLKK